MAIVSNHYFIYRRVEGDNKKLIYNFCNGEWEKLVPNFYLNENWLVDNLEEAQSYLSHLDAEPYKAWLAPKLSNVMIVVNI